MGTYMTAYELLPKLIHLTLAGQDEEGNLEWIGTREQWDEAQRMEDTLCSI